MKLKLSTLVVIIGLIFFGYYYFIYSPCQAAKPPVHTGPGPVVPAPQIPPEEGFTMLDLQEPTQYDVIDDGMYYENFDVTPLDDYSEPESRQAIQSTYNPNEQYSLAGNVRPDNVMQVDEPVTFV